MLARLRSTTAAGRGAAFLAITLLAGCARTQPGSLGLEEKFTRWARYEGDPGANHFSALDQINKSNVKQLQVAWTYTKGGTGYNPVIADSMVYVLGTGGAITALHAATGREIWTAPNGASSGRNRSIIYWESADRSDRRIIVPRNNILTEINAVTGKQIMDFGTNGQIDVREGIGREGINANPSSPGVTFENLVILGSGTGEAYGSGPGDIRAFDVRTGKLAWIFHTIPHPGEFGYDTWKDPEAWKREGGVNVWGGMSVDDKRGIVYLPLGSATYDFYGADRLGNTLFANSLVALDARTGKRLWHFQTVHHDLWDYDLTATPTLLTVKHNGKMVDAVAQAAKTGFLFVFDRVTGEPLWPIEERAVPKSDMPGEVASPTQPFPTWPKAFAVQKFTVEDMNPYIIDPAERDSLTKIVRESNNQGLFTPPSTRPTMQMPGNTGGANWGSTGADPRDGSFFVVTKNLPTVLKLERIVPGVFGTGTSQVDRGQFVYQQNCQACHQATRAGQPPLIPSLVGITDRMTPEQIMTVVHDGRANMPAFRDLSNQEVTGIITYLTNPQLATPASALGVGAPAAGAQVEDGGPLRFQTGYGYFSASGGMWGQKPPYMTMTKYDLNTGDIRWQVPIGEIESLTARGITAPTGAAELRGGPAVTAGGLVFMMTGKKLRAYDKDNGQELWSADLPATGDGIPAVYRWGGREYVIVGTSGPRPAGAAAGGGGGGGAGRGAAPPGVFVAYALPASVAR
jgi:quinoprotein glucose dehydrogenase